MDTSAAIRQRKSVRGFLPKPVSDGVLRELFEKAQQAPSWCNIQPWRVWVTSGPTTQKLAQSLMRAARSEKPSPDYPWPQEYPEPYASDRRRCGKALYDAMGIERGDKVARDTAWLRNYEAFEAPHVAIVGFDKRFDLYAALDVGCWLQTLMLLATEAGLGTCAQASLARHPRAVRAVLPIPDEIGIVCGIALGYENVDCLANRCRTSRRTASQNIDFC